MRSRNRNMDINQSVFDALCREYGSIFILQMPDDHVEIVHITEEFQQLAKNVSNYEEGKNLYCEQYICENDRERMKSYASLEHVARKLKQQETYELIYQTNDYEWMAGRFYKINSTEQNCTRFLLGIVKYNQDMQEEQRVRRVNEIITSFSESFQAIYRVNLLTGDLEILLLKFEEKDFVYKARNNRELEKNYRERYVDPAFLECLEKEASMDAIREHFRASGEPVVMFYREKSGRWMKLVIAKDVDYTEARPYVIYAIKESNRQVRERTKSVVNQMAMVQMFLLAITINLQDRTYQIYHYRSSFFEICPSGTLDDLLVYLKKYIYEEDYEIFCSLIFQPRQGKEGFMEREFRAEGGNGMFHMLCGYSTFVLLPEGERLLLLIQNIDERAVNRARINSLNRQVARANSMIYALSDSYYTVYSVDMATDTVVASRYSDDIVDEIRKDHNIISIMDKYIAMYVHPDDRENMKYFLKKDRIQREMNEVGKRDYFEFLRNLNGNYQWIRLEILTTKCEDGQIKEMVFAFQDIHNERVRQLQQNQELKRALRAAEAANTAKTTFLSNMSHDIRTPMNAILGLTDLAIKHMDQKELVQANLYKIAEAGQNLLGLINEVLDMSYIESGKLMLQNTEFSLTDLVSKIERMMENQIQRKRISYHSDLTRIQIPTVSADNVRLNQIITNLLGNAIKYTPDGGSIWFSVKQEKKLSEESDQYEISIRDTGIGMNEDMLKRAFLPFEQEKNAAGGAEGVGLGLSITKELVELMGGTIMVESKLGSGSTFVVTLPLKIVLPKKKTEPESEQEEDGSGQEMLEASRNGLKGKKILVVDDNEINLEIACDYLEDVAAVAYCAKNGEEAVRMVQENPVYDAVLMDVRMPVMGGYEAAKRIKQMNTPYTDKLPIIAMTANAFAEDVKLSKLSGMVDHLSKPVNADKLYYALYRQMSHISDS